MLHVLYQRLFVPDVFLKLARVLYLEIVIWLRHDLSLREGARLPEPLGLIYAAPVVKLELWSEPSATLSASATRLDTVTV